MRLRQGGLEDAPTLLRMFDDAVDWLTERGSSGQWGAQPWSEIPARVERVREIASEGLWLAEIGGSVAGALVIDETPSDYAPPSGERELYVHWLLVARGYKGQGVGGRLLNHARAQARERGISLIRVDCWSGGDGALIRYYARQGFTPTVRVLTADKEIQMFEVRI